MTLLVWASTAGAAPIPGGFLSQPTGRSSCINSEGASHCLQGRALGSAFGIALDASGQHAYVTSFNQPNNIKRSLGSLAVLDRFPKRASLMQSDDPASCFTNGALEDCGAGHGLLGALSPAVSPDGRNVYVATQNGVSVFSRNATTGRVTPLPGAAGCLNESGTDDCAPARMVQNASSIVVSPNGRFVYVAAYGPTPALLPFQPTRSGVAIFERDPTGALIQRPDTLGCVAEDGASGCTAAAGLLGAATVTMSPNGKTLYVGTTKQVSRESGTVNAGSVVALSANSTDGSLRPLTGHGGCIAEGPVTGCDQGRGMLGITSVIAPDNNTVYAVGSFSQSIVVMHRAADGRVTQLATGTDGGDGCTSATGADGCATAASLQQARVAVASHDGFHVYVAGGLGVSTFLRADRGRLVQLSGDYGCISQAGAGNGTTGCFLGHGLLGPQALAIDPLDRFVYVATAGNFGASAPGGGVVTLERNARPAPLRITAKLRKSSCRAKTFKVDIRVTSPLPFRVEGSVDGGKSSVLSKKPFVPLNISARAYRVGSHRLVATARDITGRVRHDAVTFRRC